MQAIIVESQFRFQTFVFAFCGCLCPHGWMSIVTGLGLCCHYLHDRHVFPNTVLVICTMSVFPNEEFLPV